MLLISYPSPRLDRDRGLGLTTDQTPDREMRKLLFPKPHAPA
nr:MAG TPA_asm: hypothetical protein [Caudoviricetes sp.]